MTHTCSIARRLRNKSIDLVDWFCRDDLSHPAEGNKMTTMSAKAAILIAAAAQYVHVLSVSVLSVGQYFLIVTNLWGGVCTVSQSQKETRPPLDDGLMAE